MTQVFLEVHREHFPAPDAATIRRDIRATEREARAPFDKAGCRLIVGDPVNEDPLGEKMYVEVLGRVWVCSSRKLSEEPEKRRARRALVRALNRIEDAKTLLKSGDRAGAAYAVREAEEFCRHASDSGLVERGRLHATAGRGNRRLEDRRHALAIAREMELIRDPKGRLPRGALLNVRQVMLDRHEINVDTSTLSRWLEEIP